MLDEHMADLQPVTGELCTAAHVVLSAQCNLIRQRVKTSSADMFLHACAQCVQKYIQVHNCVRTQLEKKNSVPK